MLTIRQIIGKLLICFLGGVHVEAWPNEVAVLILILVWGEKTNNSSSCQFHSHLHHNTTHFFRHASAGRLHHDTWIFLSGDQQNVILLICMVYVCLSICVYTNAIPFFLCRNITHIQVYCVYGWRETWERYRGAGSFSVVQDWDNENKGGHRTHSVLGFHTVKGKGRLFFSFLSLHYPKVLISLG